MRQKPYLTCAKWPRLIVSLLVALTFAATLGAASMALAAPPIPYSPWGIVTINGVAAPDGIEVTAWIEGVQYAATTTQQSYYALDVPGDDPDTAEKDGGLPGETVTFQVGEHMVDQSGTWQSGNSVQLDLGVEAPGEGYRLRLPLILRG